MSFSQNTVEITGDELRTANLIFMEHAKLKQEVPLLKEQILNLEKVDSNWVVTDSLRKKELELYNSELQNQYIRAQKLQDDLNKHKKITNVTIIGSLAIMIACIILK